MAPDFLFEDVWSGPRMWVIRRGQMTCQSFVLSLVLLPVSLPRLIAKYRMGRQNAAHENEEADEN
jgi:hypothetical protein